MAEGNEKSITITEKIEIPGQPPFVWNVFRDMEAWPEWNPICTEALWIAGPSWGKDSTFRLGVRLGGEATATDAAIVESDFPWVVGWTRTIGDVVEHRRFDLDWEGRTSIVTDTITLTATDDSTDISTLEAAYREMSQGWLRALKDEVEKNGDKLWNLSAADRPQGAPSRTPKA